MPFRRFWRPVPLEGYNEPIPPPLPRLSARVSEIDKARLDQLRRPVVTIYLVDDCTPETLGVFTSFESAIEFADLEQADRIRVGELDSRKWAEIKWERNRVTGKWERYQ